MTGSASQFVGSIPENYDTGLGPNIFHDYADDLARRAGASGAASVLELAAGTGIVSRKLCDALAPEARLVVTDLNPPMLDRAAAMQPAPDDIEWLPANALDLPLDDDEFDAVVCQFGCMFFPDRVKAYSEARRVLRPGGTFVYSMWDRIEENDFANVVTTALAGMHPNNPPRFLSRTPHGHYDTGVYVKELVAAGFSDISVEPLDAVSSASSSVIPAVAYCQGTPLRNEIEDLDPGGLGRATDHAAGTLASRFGEGRIRAFVITVR